MSVEIAKNDLSMSEIRTIKKDLTLKVVTNRAKGKTATKNDFIFDCDEKFIRIPFAYGRKYIEPEPLDIKAEARGFTGKLREQQTDIAAKSLRMLAENGSAIISACTGAGKTVTSIYVATVLQRKTLILTNKIMLIKQWAESIATFCPDLACQVLLPKKTVKNPDATFYIANPVNLPKFPKEFYDDIDVVIADELHQLISPKGLRNLFYLRPVFLIGLSATPIRYDSYDQCISMFFGTKEVGLKLMKYHTVYAIKTNYRPPVIINPVLGLDWNAVLDGQATDEPRNELVCDIIEKLPDRNWLVLVKRIKQAEFLEKILKIKGISCELLIGNKREYNKSAKVLIGTVSKVGVGFDNPRIDSLLVAADVKAYFVQSLGRCMRKPEIKPIVVDLVDDFNPLVKNYKERETVYKNHGGTIKELEI